MVEPEPDEPDAPQRRGPPTGFSCPDCASTLFLVEDDRLIRYRCRVGHAWSAESLLAENDAALEGALWMALRSLEEKAALALVMAARATRHNQRMSAERFEDHAAEAQNAAERIRRLLLSGVGVITRGERGGEHPE